MIFARLGRFWTMVADGGPALALGVGFIVLWEFLTRLLALPVNVVPPPTWILWSLYVRLDLLAEHAWFTFYQTVVGFVVSVVLGVFIGLALSKSRLLYEAFYPLVVIFQVVPKEALAPLLVLWFDAGVLSRTILAFLIAFFPMVINTILGVRSLDSNARRYAISLDGSWWQVFLKVEFPWALPAIFAGMKISVTLTVVGVVVAEIVAGRSGLGYLLLFASSRLDMGFSLAVLLVLAVWGGALYGAVNLLERRAVYWRH